MVGKMQGGTPFRNQAIEKRAVKPLRFLGLEMGSRIVIRFRGGRLLQTHTLIGQEVVLKSERSILPTTIL